MQLTIKNLKNELTAFLIPEFENSGYKFIKSDFSFKKKIGGSYSRISTHFYSFAPLRLEFQFYLYFTIYAIERIAVDFYKSINLPYKDYATVTLVEGDFVPITKSLDFKWRHNFRHQISDLEPTEWKEGIISHVKQNILAQEQQFVELEQFQSYVRADFEETLHRRIFFPALVAMRLASITDYKKYFDFLMNNLDLYPNDNSRLTKELLIDFDSFQQQLQ